MMLDAEIYVDRIADMRINDMNAVLQAVRQMVLMQQGETENDLYLRTLELAQVQEDEYFGHVISDDLILILRDIREAHQNDATTAYSRLRHWMCKRVCRKLRTTKAVMQKNRPTFSSQPLVLTMMQSRWSNL